MRTHSKHWRNALQALGAIIGALLLGIVGLVIGSTYGGNNDTLFYFAGIVGYEAWGVLVAAACIGVGAAFGASIAGKGTKVAIAPAFVAGVFGSVVSLLLLMVTNTSSITIVLLPIVFVIVGIHIQRWLDVRASRWFFGSVAAASLMLAGIFWYGMFDNYACLEKSACVVKRPVVELTVESKSAAIVGKPITVVSQLHMYGKNYTLEKYCDHFIFEWNFGKGESRVEDGCQTSAPNSRPMTRRWVKHTYNTAGTYPVTLLISFNGRPLTSDEILVTVE